MMSPAHPPISPNAIKSAPSRRSVLGAGALVLAGCAPRRAAPTTAFAGLVRDYGEDLLLANPERAAFLRLADDGANLTRLADQSGLAAELGRSAVLRRLSQLLALEAKEIRGPDRLIYGVLLAHFSRLEPALKLGIGRFSQIDGPAPFALDQETAAVMALPALLANLVTIHDLADAEDYLVLLNRCAGTINAQTRYAMEQAQAGWIAPPEVLGQVGAACAQLLAQAPSIGPFIAPLRAQLQAAGLLAPPSDGLAQGIAEPAASPAQSRAQALLAQAETLVARDIHPAISRAAQMCAAQASLGKPLTPEFSRQWLEAGLRFTTGDRIDLEKADSNARQQRKILIDQLDMSLRALGMIDGSVGQRLAQLGPDPRFDQTAAPPESLVSAMNAHFAAANALSGNWFHAGAFSGLTLRILDGFADLGADGALYRPAGARAEDRATLSLDLARLRGMPRFALADLAFSQGMPGHHALSSLAKGANTPQALKMITVPAFLRGWCRYGAQLADEYGLNESEPWQHIGFLQRQLHGCALLLADLDLSWRLQPRAGVAADLQAITGMAASEALRAVDAMQARPGAACAAELGRGRIVAARDRARIGLGPDFDIRTFHGLILGGGELPLGVMDARIDAWIHAPRKSKN